MGWSCRADAMNTMREWEKVCRFTTASSNCYEVNGQRYFFETSRTEHDDGAITGSVWKMLPDGRARKSGGFRIEGDGAVKRYPVGMAQALAALEGAAVLEEQHSNYNRVIGESLRR